MLLEGCLIVSVFTGYYIYIETSYPRVRGDNAKLEISVSGAGELYCLEFYYHMYGDTIGTLTVFNGNAVVFNTSGNHGDYWIKAEITIYLDNTVSFYQYNMHNFLDCSAFLILVFQ